jgi:CubicO group peptidase (beta-lactamase class C family)
VFDGNLKHDNGVVPEQMDDGWEIATPQSVGLSTKVLDKIHQQLLDEDHYRAALSLLVVKDGKLVFETYLRKDSDRDTPWPIQSATKSVTSLLTGIARDQGEITSLDLTVGELFGDEVAGLDSRKRSITLRHLLTMTSGIAFDNDDFYVELWTDSDRRTGRLRYMLSKPMYAKPGAEYYYRDVDPQIVSYALSRLTGGSELKLARKTLFASLGIDNYYWEQGPDGVTMGAAGLLLTPRDLCKLGQLVLQRGIWKGKRVISEEYLLEATTAHVDSDVPYAGGVFPYGYYWWIVPGVGYSAVGHGGQFVLVVPDHNMVLVGTSFPYGALPGDSLASFLALVKPLIH